MSFPRPAPGLLGRSLRSLMPALVAAALLPAVISAAAPVLPAPGQTVTWTTAMSPITFSGNATIPAGGTVVVDPGVTLLFSTFSRLYVEGTLSAVGTSSAPIAITGPATGWLVARGEVDLFHCTISNTIAQGTNSRLHIADSLLAPISYTITDFISGPVRALVERCTVQTNFFNLVGEVVLRDVELSGISADVGGYMRLEGVTSIGTPLRLYREYQPGLVEDVSISGVSGPGLLLDGNTDFLIDASVSLTGNQWPLQTKGAGLVHGSVVPRAGNVNDAILGFEGNKVHKGDYTLPDLGLPYVFLENPDFGGRVHVDPGVTFKMGPSGRILFYGDIFRNGTDLRGLPGQPITLEPWVPGQTWLTLGGAGGTYLFEHLVIDGAGNGVAAPQAQVHVNETVIENCLQGMEPSGLGNITVKGSRFLDNGIGALGDSSFVSSGGLTLNGTERPNVFTGNGIAVKKGNLNSGVIPAQGNWWNHASGPQAPSNPGGLGDPVDFNVDYTSYLATAPDLSDTPPVVRVQDPFFLADPGDVLLLHWTVDDDVAVARQDILIDLKGGGTFDFQPVVSNLPGDVTSYAFVMPDPGFNVFARPGLVRVQATDSAGQTSFDEVTVHVSSAPYTGTFTWNNDLSGTFEPLERFKLCWSAFGLPGSLRAYLVLDADERIELGPAGNPGDACTFSNFIVPYVSTDSARLAVFSDGNGNVDEWFFSEPFTIRPDAFMGDTPPVVQLLAPAGGEQVAAGGVLHVAWTAGDDDPLRAFQVQVSLNGGRTWNTVARDLPGGDTSYDWQVPPGIEVADARVRVVAIDRRFQNSSDGAQTSFAIGADATWTNLGGGIAGTAGVPVLAGDGTLTAGDSTTLSLAGGLPGGSAYVVLGLSKLGAPFKGGVLVPNPDVILDPLPLDGAGALELSFPWPAGIPSGASAFWQHWIPDATAVKGFAASNGLQGTTP